MNGKHRSHIRRARVVWILVPLLLLTGGCIRSIHPIHTEATVKFDSRLVGARNDPESTEVWAFSCEDDTTYGVIYTDSEGKTGKFRVHLAEVDGQRFLDFYPREPELDENDFYGFHLFPVHTFVHLQQIHPVLEMRFPDPDWLRKHLSANPAAIAHETMEGEVILTAKPEELQAFWVEHLGSEGAFGEASQLVKD